MYKFRTRTELMTWLLHTDEGREIWSETRDLDKRIVFDTCQELITWLVENPDGRNALCDAKAASGRRPTLLAVQSASGVELYASQPMTLKVHTKVFSTLAEAETLLEMEMRPLTRRVYEPGKYVGHVENKKFTIQEYEWWLARKGAIEDAKVIGGIIRGD